MPGVAPLGKQRKPGHEHGECERKSEELPQQRRQAGLTEVAYVIAPIEHGEFTRGEVIAGRWVYRRQQEVSGQNACGGESRGYEDRVLIAVFRKKAGQAGSN